MGGKVHNQLIQVHDSLRPKHESIKIPLKCEKKKMKLKFQASEPFTGLVIYSPSRA